MTKKSRTTITHEDWEALGTKLFGVDKLNWKFVCPACDTVQTMEDFRPYQGQGAKPGYVTQMCIGNYMGDEHNWLDGETKPCDYKAFGLLHISPYAVVVNGKEVECFAFYEGEETDETIN